MLPWSETWSTSQAVEWRPRAFIILQLVEVREVEIPKVEEGRHILLQVRTLFSWCWLEHS